MDVVEPIFVMTTSQIEKEDEDEDASSSLLLLLLLLVLSFKAVFDMIIILFDDNGVAGGCRRSSWSCFVRWAQRRGRNDGDGNFVDDGERKASTAV